MRFNSQACQRQASPRTTLTQIADPDKTIFSHVCCSASNALHLPRSGNADTETKDGPVKTLQMYVFAFALAGSALVGSISAASAEDAALGEKVFLKCKACHQIGEGAKDAVGPVLNGVVGRKAGTYPDYNYSDANKNSGITWDVATLKEYLKNPRAKVPGTKMLFPGLTKEDDIDNVIAYLKQFGADGKKT
jgi:cytochrome c